MLKSTEPSWRYLSAALALLLAANCPAQPATQTGTTHPSSLRVLILSGDGTRDWRSSTLFLRQLLAEAGHCEVRICESPAGITPETLAGFDVVVDDYSGPRLGRATEEALAGFVHSGKGLVITHGALAATTENTFQLGHDHSPFRHPSYRALVHNSILWTAGRLN